MSKKFIKINPDSFKGVEYAVKVEVSGVPKPLYCIECGELVCEDCNSARNCHDYCRLEL